MPRGEMETRLRFISRKLYSFHENGIQFTKGGVPVKRRNECTLNVLTAQFSHRTVDSVSPLVLLEVLTRMKAVRIIGLLVLAGGLVSAHWAQGPG